MGSSWPLVGRRDELAATYAAIAETGGVVLTGPAGVGKSRLAREALELAQHRVTRWIAATETARSVPLGALAEFAGQCGSDPLRRVEEVIDALTGDEPPMTVFFCVDDAHLLDEQSALVVQQLVDRGIAPVVMTIRDGEVAPEAITSLLESALLRRIEIRPLAAGDVTSLLEHVLGGPLESSSAQRFWFYTQGNPLYLRQLIADEYRAGQLTQRAGVWVWDGAPRLSASLVELIESTIGRQDDSVIDVLDILAVSDPVELPVLLSVASTATMDAAAARGLITVDAVAGLAHLAHPLFGDVRRNRSGTARLRVLRGRVADAIGALPGHSLVRSVRRGVLVMDSDGKHDPALLQEAAEAALQLLDLHLAVKLARCAVEAGGGRSAQLTYALAMGTSGRGREGDEILASLAATAEGAELAHVALLRAANLAWILGHPQAAERVLADASDAASVCGLASSYGAIRASCRAALGHPSEAVELATVAFSGGQLQPLAAMLGYGGLVCALGDLGRIDRLQTTASQAYDLALSAPDASHLRFGVGLMDIVGRRLAGALEPARDVAVRLRHQSQDVGVSQSLTALLMGVVEMSCGDLRSAQRWFRESLAQGAEMEDESGSVRQLAGLWLTTTLAMAGDRVAARSGYEQTLQMFGRDFSFWETDLLLTQAWLHAVSGSSSCATALCLEAARAARQRGRPAQEVLCLQTATQLGNMGAADRLKEISTLVQGPRAGAAYAHAAALRKGDGAALLTASGRYESFGDRIAAADAAAQAALVSDKRGQCQTAAAAAAVARRLTTECGSNTVTYQAMTTSTMLTGRQREVITLAATGLSNHDIADRLVMSVRTVEGHLFRAAKRSGVSTRDELIALVDGTAREPS